MDELAARRQAKQGRLMVNAYGDDGYVLIDCPPDNAIQLRDELLRLYPVVANGEG